MAQEVEIEVKSGLDEQAFSDLMNYLNVSKNEAIQQHNHYFETPLFSLKNVGAGLRVREIDDTFTLTLKQPNEIGKLETHQSLNKSQWRLAREHGQIPDGQVKTQLLNLQIPLDNLSYLGTLSTNRIEIPYNEGILCLDESFYLDRTDYEIEFEGNTEEHAYSTLNQLLQKVNLPMIQTENKVKRFFKRKAELEAL